MRFHYHHILPLLLLSVLHSSTVRAQAPAATPTLWIIGDSTVKNGTKGLRGWGEEIGAFFDPTKITVQNRALGGRSSRTYFTEGLWAKVADQIKPGDYVLMQFGHNDGGKVSGELSPGRPARASLKGTGEDTQVADVGTTGQKETVHSYGWYLRQFIEGAKAKGATPIVLSPVPRDDWKDGKVLRSTDYGKWASDVAISENVPFIDLNGIIADQYDQLGQDKVKTFFPFEHTHTSAEGAQLNAKSVIKGIQGLSIPLKDCIAANPPATTTDLAPSVAK
jgi:lysophospholipase L1-like esterase